MRKALIMMAGLRKLIENSMKNYLRKSKRKSPKNKKVISEEKDVISYLEYHLRRDRMAQTSRNKKIH